MENNDLMSDLLELIDEYLSQDQKVSDNNIVEHIMKMLVKLYDI